MEIKLKKDLMQCEEADYRPLFVKDRDQEFHSSSMHLGDLREYCPPSS